MFILGIGECDRIGINIDVPSIVACGLVRVRHYDRLCNERSVADRHCTIHGKSDGGGSRGLFWRGSDRGGCCEFLDVGDRAVVTGCCVWVGRCGVYRGDRLCVAVVSEAVALWSVGGSIGAQIFSLLDLRKLRGMGIWSDRNY